MAITVQNLKPDLRMAHMISMEIKLLLSDATNLRNTPFMDFVGSINGQGSDTIRVRKAFLDGESGWSEFSGGTEADAVTPSSLVDESTDVVVKRQALAYEISDLASMTGMGNDIDPFRIAEHIAKSYEARFANLTGALLGGFTAQVGAASALTVSVFLDAIQTLESADSGKGAPGPYVCVLAPQQFAELQDSIRAEATGILQFVAPSYEAISAKGSHYKGSFMGVEIYTSSYVTDDTVNFSGAMFAPGAIGYATGAPAGLPGAVESMEMGEVVIEMDRDATKALTRIVGHAYLGMSIIENERGVEIFTLV